MHAPPAFKTAKMEMASSMWLDAMSMTQSPVSNPDFRSPDAIFLTALSISLYMRVLPVEASC